MRYDVGELIEFPAGALEVACLPRKDTLSAFYLSRRRRAVARLGSAAAVAYP